MEITFSQKEDFTFMQLKSDRFGMEIISYSL